MPICHCPWRFSTRLRLLGQVTAGPGPVTSGLEPWTTHAGLACTSSCSLSKCPVQRRGGIREGRCRTAEIDAGSRDDRRQRPRAFPLNNTKGASRLGLAAYGVVASSDMLDCSVCCRFSQQYLSWFRLAKRSTIPLSSCSRFTFALVVVVCFPSRCTVKELLQ
jgi:hypothetical protein